MTSRKKGADLVPKLPVAQPLAGLFVADGDQHRQQVARVGVGPAVLGNQAI